MTSLKSTRVALRGGERAANRPPLLKVFLLLHPLQDALRERRVSPLYRGDQHLTLALIQHPWPLRWLFMIPQMFMHLHLRLHHAAISLDRLLLQYFGTTGGRQFGDYGLRWPLHPLQGDLPEPRLSPLYRGDQHLTLALIQHPGPLRCPLMFMHLRLWLHHAAISLDRLLLHPTTIFWQSTRTTTPINPWHGPSSNILDLYGGYSWSPDVHAPTPTITYGWITPQLALTDSYCNILVPKVAGNLALFGDYGLRWPLHLWGDLRELHLLPLYRGGRLTLALIQHPWPLRWLFMIPCSCTYTYGCITQQLALTDSYYNILAPQVAGNLATTDYEGLVTLYKVIYQNHASRHYIEEINTWRWLSSNILDLCCGNSRSPWCSCTYAYGCITQQLALTDSCYNILAPQVAGNLVTTNYDGLFTLYKVIYRNYASGHYIEETTPDAGSHSTSFTSTVAIHDPPDVHAPTPTAYGCITQQFALTDSYNILAAHIRDHFGFVATLRSMRDIDRSFSKRIPCCGRVCVCVWKHLNRCKTSTHCLNL